MSDNRVHAAPEEPFVLFLVGMRLNDVWRVHRWLPVFLAMPRMLRELDEGDGLLGSRLLVGWRTLTVVQYWESFEHLRAYARDGEREHVPAWSEYARTASDGAVGVWHETYRVDPADHESVYREMPPYGLGAAVGTEPASGTSETAAGRLDGTDDEPRVPVGGER